MNSSKTLEELIYGLELLSYYFGMKPSEFWNSEYKEIYLYCQVCLIKDTEDFKRQIIIQEAVSDKLIQADCMRERPKVVPLKKMFKGLFKK